MKFIIEGGEKGILAEFNYPLFKGCSLDALREIAYACECVIREVEHDDSHNVVVHFALDEDREDLCKAISINIGDLNMAIYDLVLLEKDSPYIDL